MNFSGLEHIGMIVAIIAGVLVTILFAFWSIDEFRKSHAGPGLGWALAAPVAGGAVFVIVYVVIIWLLIIAVIAVIGALAVAALSYY